MATPFQSFASVNGHYRVVALSSNTPLYGLPATYLQTRCRTLRIVIWLYIFGCLCFPLEFLHLSEPTTTRCIHLLSGISYAHR